MSKIGRVPDSLHEACVLITYDYNIGKRFDEFERIPQPLINKIENFIFPLLGVLKNPEIYFRKIKKLFRQEDFNGQPIVASKTVKREVDRLLKGNIPLISEDGWSWYCVLRDLDHELKTGKSLSALC